MVSPVSSSSAVHDTTTAPKPGTSVALQDKLARCVKQLGDWEGCPSGKTPEGQKIIQNLRTQIDTIQSKISQSKQDVTKPTPSGNTDAIVSTPTAGASNLGGQVDVYI